MLRRLGPKRVALLLSGLGYLGLFVDAYIGHVAASGGISSSPQYVPLVLAPLAFALLSLAGVPALPGRALARITFGLGLVSVVGGLVGVAFHLAPVLEDLADESLTPGALTGALGSAPPLLAPAAFLGLGLLVGALGLERLSIVLEPRHPWDSTLAASGRADARDASSTPEGYRPGSTGAWRRHG